MTFGHKFQKISELFFTSESRTAKMRRCLTKFSRHFEFGAVHHLGTMPRICAVLTRSVRAACLVHLLFSTTTRPRCFAAVWWFLLRGRGLRPEDARQKRFSCFYYWTPRLQKCVNLVDLVESFKKRVLLYLLAKIGFTRSGAL